MNCENCKKLTGGLCKKCLKEQDNNFMNQTNKEIENSQKDIKSGYLGEEGDDVLVYTTNQTNNRIREGWIEKVC